MSNYEDGLYAGPRYVHVTEARMDTLDERQRRELLRYLVEGSVNQERQLSERPSPFRYTSVKAQPRAVEP